MENVRGLSNANLLDEDVMNFTDGSDPFKDACKGDKICLEYLDAREAGYSGTESQYRRKRKVDTAGSIFSALLSGWTSGKAGIGTQGKPPVNVSNNYYQNKEEDKPTKIMGMQPVTFTLVAVGVLAVIGVSAYLLMKNKGK